MKDSFRGLQFSWRNWPVQRDAIRVRHGSGGGSMGGPAVKLRRMQRCFPNTPQKYNLIYTVSGSVPEAECRWAKRLGIPIVCHVNSCWHPAYAEDWAWRNRKFVNIHNNLADFIVYGSDYAKTGANRYLGPSQAPHKIIYNAVDTNHFKPPEMSPDPKRFHILVPGLHNLRHRIEPMLQAMPHILAQYPQAKLIIAGRTVAGEGIWHCSQESFEGLLSRMNISFSSLSGENNLTQAVSGQRSAVIFTGEYTQAQAPEIYTLGDVLVHLKHMDWTPNTVAEGMACGLPIVHPGNGGLPEIVGQAGVSLDLAFDWDTIHSPQPELLAKRVIEAYENRHSLGQTARNTAVERYDLQNWAAQHQAIFEKLL